MQHGLTQEQEEEIRRAARAYMRLALRRGLGVGLLVGAIVVVVWFYLAGVPCK